MHYLIHISVFLICVFLSSSGFSSIVQPVVILEEEHHPSWFTQGLFAEPGDFYISSGKYGSSKLIKQLSDKTLIYPLPSKFFAEGLTIIGDDIYLLTWQEQTLFVFDKHSLRLKDQKSYVGEGWGLTHSDGYLIMSNGSNTLQFRNKHTFALEKTLDTKINRLNELEYIEGVIWANRWYDDSIYAIDVNSGCIRARVDLKKLRASAVEPNQYNIVNGIAYDRERNALWVTGKYWPKRYLIEMPQLSRGDCL